MGSVQLVISYEGGTEWAVYSYIVMLCTASNFL